MEMTVPPPAPPTTEELHALIAGSVEAHGANEHGASSAAALAGQRVGGVAAPAVDPPAPARLSDDDTQLHLMGLTAADLDHATSDPFLSAGLAAPLDLEKLEPEILQWMEQCRVANHGLDASEDDALYFLDTKYPEQLQGDGMTRVFTWLSRFLPRVAGSHPRFSEELKATAAQIIATLDVANRNNAETLATIATEFGLKSSTTLLFWKRQNDERVLSQLAQENAPASNELMESSAAPAQDDSDVRSDAAGRRRGSFLHEKEVLEWVLARRGTPLTSLDIVSHIVSAYPDFAEGRSSTVLSVWVSRFLKRHLPSESINQVEVASNDPKLAVESGGIDAAKPADEQQPETSDSSASLGKNSQDSASAVVQSTSERPRKKRTKRSSPEGYVLHSNEFKLNALKKLDEGKTISEVAEELGLKCTNTLVYWNSIRDKLAVADKKRFRLAGGGRRSTCTFEGELMSWISDRQQKGIGTDVRAVLAYMREFHPSFTDGKKEPTLRKWILRFFQRWRQQSVCTGASGDDDGAEAAHHDEEDDEELRKSTGILV
ncbi:hypothetical protein ATCC90586_002236 [Pythium insidiosum]|nr:hypothetical protein ATCC90586_002236 [Pythium insidiosum]